MIDSVETSVKAEEADIALDEAALKAKEESVALYEAQMKALYGEEIPEEIASQIAADKEEIAAEKEDLAQRKQALAEEKLLLEQLRKEYDGYKSSLKCIRMPAMRRTTFTVLAMAPV